MSETKEQIVPSVAIAIYKIEHSFGDLFVAFVVANPTVRASGKSSEDAMTRLKRNIYSHIEGELIEVVDVPLNELVVQSVMTR